MLMPEVSSLALRLRLVTAWVSKAKHALTRPPPPNLGTRPSVLHIHSITSQRLSTALGLPFGYSPRDNINPEARLRPGDNNGSPG